MTQKVEPPAVSVVIPAYNAAWCVGKAIDSVLVQEFRVLFCKPLVRVAFKHIVPYLRELRERLITFAIEARSLRPFGKSNARRFLVEHYPPHFFLPALCVFLRFPRPARPIASDGVDR